MADVLSEKARELIARPVLASLATLNPNGSPQITPLWVDRDGDDVLFNTAEGRKKARNMEKDARGRRDGHRPERSYNVVAFRGTVVDVTTEGADAHIDALAEEVPRCRRVPDAPGGRGPDHGAGAHRSHRHAGLIRAPGGSASDGRRYLCLEAPAAQRIDPRVERRGDQDGIPLRTPDGRRPV